jgi:hypothetical protein
LGSAFLGKTQAMLSGGINLWLLVFNPVFALADAAAKRQIQQNQRKTFL